MAVVHKLRHWIKVYFVTGLVVSLPVLGSFWIFSVIFVKITNLIFKYVAPIGATMIWERMLWRLFALFILFLLVMVIGILARNIVGRFLIRTGEYVVAKVPVLNKIYAVLKQIFESIWGRERQKFRGVVAVQFPSEGIYSIGFLTAEAAGEISRKTGSGNVGIFIPTVPNPTTGFFIYVPRDKVILLDMAFEDAAKLLFSTGVITPK